MDRNINDEMSFSEFVRINEAGGDGSALTNFSKQAGKDIIGGGIDNRHKNINTTHYIEPTKTNNKSYSSVGVSSDAPKTKKSVNPDTSSKPKTPTARRYVKGAGGHGYFNARDKSLFNDMESKIKSGDFDKYIVSKRKFKTKAGIQGYIIKYNDDINDVPDTLYVLTNSKDSPVDWSSICFVQRVSLEKALRVFYREELKNKRTRNKFVSNIKWNMVAPADIENPVTYASWTRESVPASDRAWNQQCIDNVLNITESDIDITNDALNNVYLDLIESSNSLSEYNEYYALYETFIDDLMQKAVKKVAGGIGGTIKSILIKPPVKKLNKPKDLLKFYPNNGIYRINKAQFDTINAICSESFGTWTSLKKENGTIAQTLLRMSSNIYIDKVFRVYIPEPTNKDSDDKVIAFNQELDDVIRIFDIDVDRYDVRIEYARMYRTTNMGYISALYFSLLEKSPSTDTNTNEAVDARATDISETIIILGVTKHAIKFFKNNYNLTIDAFLRRYARNKRQDIFNLMDQTRSSIQGAVASINNSEKVLYKRSNIEWTEFDKLQTKILDTLMNNGLLDPTNGYKQTKNGDTVITRLNLKNGGQVVLSGIHNHPCQVIVSNDAVNEFFNIRQLDIQSKYKQEKLK